MIDIESTCRICLGNNAVYNIFAKRNGNMLNKIVLCFNEKIENIEGYPSNICLKCKRTIDLICEFRSKYQESCKILESKVVEVKVEFDSDNEVYEEFVSQIFNKEPKDEPEVKQSTTELLDSLKELTIKKVNVKIETDSIDNDNIDNEQNLPKSTKANLNHVKRLRNNHKKNASTSKKSVSKNNSQSSKKKVNNKESSNKVTDENKKIIKSEAKNIVKATKTRLCDTCGETFSNHLDLQTHKRTHKPKSFICDLCPDKVYNLKGSLIDHILRVHEKIKNAVCDTCGKAFYGKKQLFAHVRVVHLKIIKKSVRKYNCRFCDCSYHYKRGVVIHERSVHTGERPSVCSVCKAAFYDNVYLREHMRLHTGDIPFKCPICWRGYAQRGNMKSHMRNHNISDINPEVLSKLKPSYLKFLRP